MIDADGRGRGRHGGRINTIMQTCFFAISACSRATRPSRIKDAIQATYGRKGGELVEQNFAAVDRTLENLHEVTLPETATSTRAPAPIVPPMRRPSSKESRP